jgi:hypothetical protein
MVDGSPSGSKTGTSRVSWTIDQNLRFSAASCTYSEGEPEKLPPRARKGAVIWRHNSLPYEEGE